MCDYASYRAPDGWKEIEPEDEDPLRKWKMHPLYDNKNPTTINQVKRKYTGIEFLDDVIR